VDLNNLKLNEKLTKQSIDMVKAFDIDNRQRTISLLAYAFMLFLAFFLSLANADFNFRAIGTARFWLDFIITFGGSQFLKYVWGKYGITEGYKDKKVIELLTSVSVANKEIKNRDLVTALKGFIDYVNLQRKFKVYKDLVYKHALRYPKRQEWQTAKEYIRLQELYFKLDGQDPEGAERVMGELEDLNFSLEALEYTHYWLFGYIPVKLRYKSINESTLKTGYEDVNIDEDDFEFSEMYELFGKNSIITVTTSAMSFLLAMMSISSQDLSLAIFFVFLTRIALYTVNSYIGYNTGKEAIEKTKSKQLSKIDNFLATFLEANKKTAQEVKYYAE
jgi:hypothetical protein